MTVGIRKTNMHKKGTSVKRRRVFHQIVICRRDLRVYNRYGNNPVPARPVSQQGWSQIPGIPLISTASNSSRPVFSVRARIIQRSQI